MFSVRIQCAAAPDELAVRQHQTFDSCRMGAAEELAMTDYQAPITQSRRAFETDAWGESNVTMLAYELSGQVSMWPRLMPCGVTPALHRVKSSCGRCANELRTGRLSTSDAGLRNPRPEKRNLRAASWPTLRAVSDIPLRSTAGPQHRSRTPRRQSLA